jgi:hypothetical protein
MPEPSKEELLQAAPGSVDTEQLQFPGLRGDLRRHLTRAALETAIADLPPAPRDRGSVQLLVARGQAGERFLHDAAELTREGGMPGDRWFGNGRYGPNYQLATTRSDFARVVANGQPLELHGDNLYLHLDISSENLPPGSLVQLGGALTMVTPQAHNGCKKWVQRFGLDAMQLNLAPAYRGLHLRGIYLQVVEDGTVRVGDPAVVVARATTPSPSS